MNYDLFPPPYEGSHNDYLGRIAADHAAQVRRLLADAERRHQDFFKRYIGTASVDEAMGGTGPESAAPTPTEEPKRPPLRGFTTVGEDGVQHITVSGTGMSHWPSQP